MLNDINYKSADIILNYLLQIRKLVEYIWKIKESRKYWERAKKSTQWVSTNHRCFNSFDSYIKNLFSTL